MEAAGCGRGIRRGIRWQCCHPRGQESKAQGAFRTPPGGSTPSTALRVLSLNQFRYELRYTLGLAAGEGSWSSGHYKMLLPLSKRQESAPQLGSGPRAPHLWLPSWMNYLGSAQDLDTGSWCVTWHWCCTLAALPLPRESTRTWCHGAGSSECLGGTGVFWLPAFPGEAAVTWHGFPQHGWDNRWQHFCLI